MPLYVLINMITRFTCAFVLRCLEYYHIWNTPNWQLMPSRLGRHKLVLYYIWCEGLPFYTALSCLTLVCSAAKGYQDLSLIQVEWILFQTIFPNLFFWNGLMQLICILSYYEIFRYHIQKDFYTEVRHKKNLE